MPNAGRFPTPRCKLVAGGSGFGAWQVRRGPVARHAIPCYHAGETARAVLKEVELLSGILVRSLNLSHPPAKRRRTTGPLPLTR